MSVAERIRPAAGCLPPAPRTPEETGLPESFLVELAAKSFYLGGAMSLSALSERLALPVSVCADLAEFLKKERMAELRKGGDVRPSCIYAITDLGRERAREFLAASSYAGPAPVTLRQYVEVVQAQSIRRMPVDRESMRRAFDNVVLPTGLLDRLGPAMNSGRSIFLYGPSGCGKTFLAERLARVLRDAIAVPHAILVDGQVVRVFDPADHRPVPDNASWNTVDAILHGPPAEDRRFVACERPAIMAGGELTLDMLDLRLDPVSRHYEAPLQMKANGGVFLIDDLGRQRVRPFDLFNRWILPLERGRDFLALHTGKKFEVPFDQVVLFSTNLEPKELADEAFLRRLGYKIRLGHLDSAAYVAICRQVCQRLGMEFRVEPIRHLLEKEHGPRKVPLSACHPGDILSRVAEICRYEGTPPRLDEELVARACRDYFTES